MDDIENIQVENSVKKIISEILGIEKDKISKNSSFSKDLGADSLDIIELIMSIEETFKINILDKDIDNIITVNDIICYIKNKKNKSS